MDKLTSALEKYVLPIAEKISANKSLQAVMSGFMVVLPITILGAIATLLFSLQVPVYQTFITSTGLKAIFSYIPAVTTNMLAVYVAYTIGKGLTEQLGHEKQSTTVGILTLFVFLMMIPLGVTGTAPESKEVVTIGAALGTTYLGAPGLFSAIILGLIGNFNAFLYNTIQSPLRSLAASPFTFMFALFMVSSLWFFGIHGGLVVMPIITALYTPLSLENLAALEVGSVLPNIIVQSDWFIFGMIGGGGATLGFCIWMAFFAKSKRYKSLGRLALPASLVGINEPITFGAPVVMNPLLYIPFAITPLVTFTISYLLRVVGILTPLNGTNIPTGTPVIFSAFIAGGWLHAVVQVLLIGVGFLIYYPFAVMLDKKALAEEINN